MTFLRAWTLVTVFLCVFTVQGITQIPEPGSPLHTPKEIKAGDFKKGEFFFYWGYNRAFFSKSNITFTGNGSDFTLYDVKAKDRPTPFNVQDYLVNISIPQFVASGGYFFRDNWSISIGTDHMKYVMVQDQQVQINGVIADSTYGGNYAGESITLQSQFLRYEHTNGLNYINAAIEHYRVLWKAKRGPFKLVAVPGLSLGVMYPRSDVDLFDIEGTNVFHVAGWGAALHAGLRINVLKNLFILWNNKGGFVALPDVLCRINEFNARQHFFYYQSAVSVGYNFRF